MILLEFKQELKQSKKKNLVLEQDMIKKMLIMIVKIDIYFVAQQKKMKQNSCMKMNIREKKQI